MLIFYSELFKNLCKIKLLLVSKIRCFVFFRVKGQYGKNEKFTYIISLVFFQCIFNAIVSKFILIVRKTHQDTTSSKMYAFVSFTYLFAMLASNYALEFVSYPMQVEIFVEGFFVFVRN